MEIHGVDVWRLRRPDFWLDGARARVLEEVDDAVGRVARSPVLLERPVIPTYRSDVREVVSSRTCR